MKWYDWQLEDGTPLLAAIALWLFVIAAFVFGLYMAGWIFRMSWLNTVYFTGLILSALSVVSSIINRYICSKKRNK